MTWRMRRPHCRSSVGVMVQSSSEAFTFSSRSRWSQITFGARTMSTDPVEEMPVELLAAEVRRLHEGLERAQRHHDDLARLLAQVTEPPWHVGVFLQADTAGERERAAIVAVGPGRRVVNIADDVDIATLAIGDEVLLSTAQNLIVAKSPYGIISSGETAVFDRFVGDRRIVVRARDEEIVVEATDRLRDAAPRAGDLVRWDRHLWLAFDKLERSQGTHLFLADTPAETFAAVGGLETQIAELQRSIRM